MPMKVANQFTSTVKAGIRNANSGLNIYHKVDEVGMENGILFLRVDGQSISKALIDISPVLVTASDKELNHYEISPSGYGIHWPLLDEDISIDGLLKIQHSPPQFNKLRKSA